MIHQHLSNTTLVLSRLEPSKSIYRARYYNVTIRTTYKRLRNVTKAKYRSCRDVAITSVAPTKPIDNCRTTMEAAYHRTSQIRSHSRPWHSETAISRLQGAQLHLLIKIVHPSIKPSKSFEIKLV